MFTQGAIELNTGTPDIRPPDLLYHTKQFNKQQSMPNYGVNRRIPTAKNVGLSSGFTDWGTGSDYGAPSIPFADIGGNCRKTQFVVSCVPKDVLDSFATFQIIFSDLSVGVNELNIYLGFGTDFCYCQQLFSGPGTTFVEFNVAWTPSNPGPGGRQTMIFGVEPTSIPILLESFPLPWPAYLNGRIPNVYSFLRTNDPSLTCGSWIQNVPISDHLFRKVTIQPAEPLGYAMYRDSFLTESERRFWHEEYDWTEDPGFI
jgi:hypothetical protein